MESLLKKVEELHIQLSEIQNKDNLDNDEVKKTQAIALSLLKRAERTLRGEIKTQRYQWVNDSYTSPEEMIEQTEELITQLRKGELPFKNRFAEIDGIVVDHALIKKDDLYHLVYIRGKACTTWDEAPMRNFGHAVSHDLVDWNVEEPVLQCSEGTWDHYQVWAPHILFHNSEYWMFYTGVNYNAAQAIGIAKSTDLYNWERYEGNPVIRTGTWGDWKENQWSDCRDPMVLRDGDGFYAYYCSSYRDEKTGEYIYCLGVSSSTDLYNWEDEGYIVLDESTKTPPESPFVVKKDGLYYLFYTDYKSGTVYAVSNHPVKGWKDAPKDKRVIIPGVSASEILQDGDKWYISYISHVKNQFHFFEIRELIWGKDGEFTVNQI